MEANLVNAKETKIEKGSTENIKKGLLVLLICLLTIYAPIELTKVIVAWGLAVQFIFELVFLWLFYGLAMFMISVKVRAVRRGKAMIKSVIRCPNDMVMVFDKEGEQIPKYQSQYHEVKESILKDAPPNAVFIHISAAELQTVSREEW